MDSNVSKNTNSHKFFKLGFAGETLNVSVKNLLKQELLSVLDTHQQNSNISIDLDWISSMLERKLSLYMPNRESFWLKKPRTQLLFQSNFVPLIYGCPIGLFLASLLQLSPRTITERLSKLLMLKHVNTNVEKGLIVYLDVTDSGWFNFVLNSESIIIWLEQSLWSIKQNSLTSSNVSEPNNFDLEHHSASLFAMQYIHARCCSLLHLAAREKLVTLKDLEQLGWWIEQPSAIPWSELTTSAERCIIRQLLIVTDCWYTATDVDLDWSKVAFGLSQNMAIFLAECRFLGEVKQQPQAIARIGLIALVQYWLQRILLEKLRIAAPKSL